MKIRETYSLKILLVFVLGFFVSFLFTHSCGSNSTNSSSDNMGDSLVSSSIVELYPPHKSVVFPQDLSIYVRLSQKPSIADIRFLVWKEGQSVPGTINLIEEGTEKEKSYKVIFSPVEREEGTYISFFSWAGEATFWSFSAEITKRIPDFSPSFSPNPGQRNFPLESSIFISPSKLLNFETIDRETVKLYRVFGAGTKFEVPYEIDFSPNSLIIWLGDRRPSTTYLLEIKNLSYFFFGNPDNFSKAVEFRTVDAQKPFIRSCSPDFCLRNNECSVVKTEFSDKIEVGFGEEEDLDPISVSKNFIIYIEDGGRAEMVRWKNIYRVFETTELLKTNELTQGEYSADLFVFPSKILAVFSSKIPSGKVIKIYILPQLSDSSGNSIDDFFIWCVSVQ